MWVILFFNIISLVFNTLTLSFRQFLYSRKEIFRLLVNLSSNTCDDLFIKGKLFLAFFEGFTLTILVCINEKKSSKRLSKKVYLWRRDYHKYSRVKKKILFSRNTNCWLKIRERLKNNMVYIVLFSYFLYNY